MKQNTNISVILPVHELNAETEQLLSNAIQSVMDQTVLPDELIIVVPKGSDVAAKVSKLSTETAVKIVVAENEGATDFASQVNYGVSVCKSDWFSILEYDDEYAKIWFKNVVEYRDAHSNVELFLPIVIDVDSENSFIGFTNEAVWANSFSDELGVLDNNRIKELEFNKSKLEELKTQTTNA